jgi:hypothetical protein
MRRVNKLNIIQEQIKTYIDSQSEEKKLDMLTLHSFFLNLLPDSKIWYLDGTNEEGKQVTNPNIGYGIQMMNYADGSSKEFYQVGFAATSTGISVFIIGLKDNKYLFENFSKSIGKATVTGYCIKFKKLSDINIEALKAAILYGVKVTKS